MYKDRIRQLQAQYVFKEHESPGEHRRNAQLIEEFGLTDPLASLGVSKLLMAFLSESGRDEKHHSFATEVMPHFR